MSKMITVLIGVCLLATPAPIGAAEFKHVCLRSIIAPVSGGRYYWYADGYVQYGCRGVPLPTGIVALGSDGPDVVCADCIPMQRALTTTEASDARGTAPITVPVGANFNYYDMIKNYAYTPRPKKAHPLAGRQLFSLPQIKGTGQVRVMMFLVDIKLQRPDPTSGQTVEVEDHVAIGFETTATGPQETVTKNDLKPECAYIDAKGNHDTQTPTDKAFYRFEYNGGVCDAIVYLVAP